ncbi:PH domain-containing protein [Psychroserpens algicola]|uniref:PH domain-containing protein n=1 Tax=Psychroserpens algicola TaxID=1719034 RepID=A0ABT0HAM6_9FLAO|nr:PH domain-containing protein [Psychroserpens algicola]MCK8481413.1 PH domain-containing protein [Psychroserpens algicola]
MNFTNTQIHNEMMPSIDDVILKPISKTYIKVIIVNSVIVYGIILSVLTAIKVFLKKEVIQHNFWYLFVIVLVICAFNFVTALLAFKKRKYAIREKDVIYAKGFIVHSVTTVPVSRIQHIETSRSWLDRKLDLATLNIYTAGESGTDLSIKGLPNKEAKQINDFLSSKVNENN